MTPANLDMIGNKGVLSLISCLSISTQCYSE